jgi:glycosyltransferase involved in cell wall biosynthesis
VKIVTIKPNAGYGGGILAGLSQATGNILGWIDADGQISPTDVVRVYRLLESGPLNMAKAVRTTREDPFIRKFQSWFYNLLFRVLFRTKCRDINAPPKLFKRKLYEKLQMQSTDWFITAECVIKALRLGEKIGEVEVTWNKRSGGKSKVNPATATEFLRKMIAYRTGKI